MTTTKKIVLTTKASKPEEVDLYISKLKHPLKDVSEALRKIILKCDKNIGEEIAWNAPCFFYAGKMKPFKPKEYKRFIVGFNYFKKDCIRLIFLRGASVNDKSGFLEGDYKDGRRLAIIRNKEELRTRTKELQKIIKILVKNIQN